MKHRISPATVMSALALFFSLGSVGMAAQHYLITSKSQIAPWVRRALKGERGPRGFAGPTGSAGIPGTPGTQGQSEDLRRTYTVDSFVGQVSTDATHAAETAVCNNMPDNAISGGFKNATGVTVTNSVLWPNRVPDGTPGHNAWLVQAELAPGATTGTFQAWVLCAPAS